MRPVEPSPEWVETVATTAGACRRRAVDIAARINGTYLGQVCSSAEVLAALHSGVLEDDDLFVLSPTHYSLALYLTLAETGRLDPSELDTFAQDGSRLEMIGGHQAPGIEFTTGSLAQGLSQGIGVALGRRHSNRPGQVVVFISDGELQEGQTWEAFMSIKQLRLDNLVIILDANNSQVDGSPEDIMSVEPIADRVEAFGLQAIEIDGHDATAIAKALAEAAHESSVVIARTDIARGIPSLASRPNLHFVRFREGEVDQARADLSRSLA